MRSPLVVFTLCVALAGALPGPLATQQTASSAAPESASERLQAELFDLTDRFGPRLAGTRAYRDAADWVAGRLRSSGVDTVYLEAFPDERPGWTAQRHSVELLAPRYRRISALPLPWTPSTDGAQTGPVVAVSTEELDRLLGASLPGGRSLDEEGDGLGLVQRKGVRDLHGAIVLLGAPRRSPKPSRSSIGGRLSDEELRRIETNPDPNDLRVGYHARRTLRSHFRRRAERVERAHRRIQGLADHGARAVLVASPEGFGVLRADGAGVLGGGFGGATAALPVFVVSAEEASLLRRLAESGAAPAVEVRSLNRAEAVPGAAVSVLAEIRGARTPEEVVLVVAHLDSHTGAPGASDNGAAVVTLLDVAARLSLGPRPDRTVRFAFLGAEEHGEFGGARGHLESGGEGVVAVLGLDHGSGLVRGIYAMGNPAAAAILREMATRLEVGGEVVTLQMSNQSDHEVFDEAGIPSFPLVQDPESYVPWTHHSQLDVPDYVDPEVMARNVVAVTGWAREFARSEIQIPPRPFQSHEADTEGREEFVLPGYLDAREVHLVGSFTSWVMFDVSLVRRNDGWRTRLELPPGRHLYKYIVDGIWTADPTTPDNELVRDGEGHGGLTVRTVR